MGTERLERSTSPKAIQLYRLVRPTDIRLMPIGWRRERDSNAHVPKDAGLANRWATYYPTSPNYPTSPITRSLRKLAEGRRFELLCAEAASVFRTGGPPVARTLRLVADLVAGYRVERSLRLFRPTLSPDQIQPALSKTLEARRRIELRVSRFADGAVTVSLRALVPEEGIEPPCRSAGS